MPRWLDALLLLVFLVHLGLFARLAWRRREAYYGAVCLTFGLLVATFALRLGEVGWEFAGRSAIDWLRLAAWASAAVSIGWLLARRRARRAGG